MNFYYILNYHLQNLSLLKYLEKIRIIKFIKHKSYLKNQPSFSIVKFYYGILNECSKYSKYYIPNANLIS